MIKIFKYYNTHNNFDRIILLDKSNNITKFAPSLSRIQFILFGGVINKI